MTCAGSSEQSVRRVWEHPQNAYPPAAHLHHKHRMMHPMPAAARQLQIWISPESGKVRDIPH